MELSGALAESWKGAPLNPHVNEVDALRFKRRCCVIQVVLREDLGSCVQVTSPAEMRSEMYDPMILESLLPYPKTLDKNIMAAGEMKAVMPENGVHENIVDVAASSHMEVTESVVGMEPAPLDLTHSTEHNGMSKHGDGAQTETAQEEGLALPTKPTSQEGVIDEQHERNDGSSSLTSPAGGNEDGAQVKALGQKKRKNRSKNWTDEETNVLLKAVSRKQKNVGRMDNSTGSEMQWDVISVEVHGRTWEECRGRMDTLKKSYITIKEYCYTHKKKFKELKEDFRDMRPKLSPRFTEDWYNQIRDYCPPRPKKRRNQVAESVPSPPKVSSGFVSCASTLGGPSAILIVASSSRNTFGERDLQHPDAQGQAM